MFVNGRRWLEDDGISTLDRFLSLMRENKLPENFNLTDEAWGDLVTRINVDQELAKEILDGGILLMLGASREVEMGGVIALAEACCGHGRVALDFK